MFISLTDAVFFPKVKNTALTVITVLRTLTVYFEKNFGAVAIISKPLCKETLNILMNKQQPFPSALQAHYIKKQFIRQN